MKKILLIFTTASFVLLFFSCKKESFITSSDALLGLSTDSIKFDTVFTSTGSVTQSLKVFNNNDQKLLLSKVKLMGGPSSPFRININGIAATEQDNIEVAANDSIYVFVTVSIDPSSANLPFIISDSIIISYNGNESFVQLQAYGQNAHFLNNAVISTNTTWPNDLPYVILGGIQVNAGATLTIDAGSKIYSHANAPFTINGSLLVNGTKDLEVQFTGDRLDDPYRDYPASWPGIFINSSSKDNIITYAIIKNAYQGIVAEGLSSTANPKLTLHQCIIDNAYDAGLLCLNSDVRADNTLISNCGKNLDIVLGGRYSFTNCTLASYSNSYLLHKLPVLLASNFADQNGSILTNNMDASFINCIFWGDNGSVDDELVISKEGNTVFNVTLDHCLYKALTDPSNTIFTSSISNIDPSFDSIDINHKYYDFRITKNSFAPGIDFGTGIGFLKDLDDKNRSVGLPDLGCYEKQ